MKTILILSGLLAGVSSFAQTTIPTAHFSGMVSSFDQFCNLNHADVQFTDSGNGSYSVEWSERGISTYGSGGECERDYDAVLTPGKVANQWNINFFRGDTFYNGTVTWTNNVLEIRAPLNSMNTGYYDFTAKFEFSPHQMNYTRSFESVGSADDRATGILYQ